MDRRAFGKTGFEVAPIGFGAGPIGYLDAEQRQVERILNLLLDRGVNLIDTAACYQASEELIGKAVGHRRDEFVLVSKCGHQVEGVTGAEWSPELITQTVERALRRLRTDHLDVMLLHSCDLPVLKQVDALAALVKARDAGKVRCIGYSGDNEEAAYSAHLAEIAVIETSINVCDQANLDAVLPPAREREIGVIAKRPIANAAWNTNRPGIYDGYGKSYEERLQQMKLSPADLGFDGPPAEVWPEIALRFTLAQPGVHTAIVGTTNPKNAEANLRAAAKGPLPEAAVKKLREAFQTAAAQSTEPWRGLT